MPKNVRFLIAVSGSALGIFLAFLWWGMLPIYGLPFGGCGPDATDPGCRNWPDAVRGFGSVIIALVVGPRSRFYLAMVLLLFFLVVALGGPVKFRLGDVYIASFGDLRHSVRFGLPFLAGGLMAGAILFMGMLFWRRRTEQSGCRT